MIPQPPSPPAPAAGPAVTPTPAPAPAPTRVLCPYCGVIQSRPDQCERCRGLFEPLSRQATQNSMGPWQVRDERQPFMPGVSYDKLREMAQKGRLRRDSIVRGPSTRQFWSVACNTPGVSVLLGECFQCHTSIATDAYLCPSCGSVQTCSTDRQHLGLAAFQPLPGDAHPHEIASASQSRAAARPASPAAPAVALASLAPAPLRTPATVSMPASAPAPAHAATLASVAMPSYAAAPSADALHEASVPFTSLAHAPSHASSRAPRGGRARGRGRQRQHSGSAWPLAIVVIVALALGLLALVLPNTPIDGLIRRSVAPEPAPQPTPQPAPAATGSAESQAPAR